MAKMVLSPGLWLAVCDGKTALLLENQGDRESPKLETRETFKQQNPPSHEQGGAPPGRAFSSIGARRSATEETDFHQKQAEMFVRDFADTINRHVESGQIRSLALVAPAKALGVIRSRLSAHARKILTAELDRDYVKMPLYEIERRLSLN